MMNKILLFLAGLFLLSGCVFTSNETALQHPQIIFDEQEFDFGVIKQSGGVVTHDFHFTYQGEGPLTILGTPGSCACTIGSVNTPLLQPGESGVLTVQFNPNLHAEPEGRFYKTVSILTEPAIEPLPEIKVWQQIELDLGEEAFELNQHTDDHSMKKDDTHESSSDVGVIHGPGDHVKTPEIGNDGKVPFFEKTHRPRSFTLTAQEINGELDEGIDYLYWTYDGVVPGPFLRAQVGDTISVTLKNPSSNHFPHSIDLHAVNGPHGGAVDVYPGQEKTFTFKALNPGIYLYHCGTKEVAEHMTNGAYGLILIEPIQPLEEVDREYSLVQGEMYSILNRGEKGMTQLSGEKLKNESPEYIVFNGRVGSLTGERALRAKVGEKIRLYVGNAGVAKISSFHVIGEVFDTVYPEGGTPVVHNVQTTLIPAGGATIVEFVVNEPGIYKLVDHALSRIHKGAVAEMIVN